MISGNLPCGYCRLSHLEVIKGKKRTKLHSPEEKPVVWLFLFLLEPVYLEMYSLCHVSSVAKVVYGVREVANTVLRLCSVKFSKANLNILFNVFMLIMF